MLQTFLCSRPGHVQGATQNFSSINARFGKLKTFISGIGKYQFDFKKKAQKNKLLLFLFAFANLPLTLIAKSSNECGTSSEICSQVEEYCPTTVSCQCSINGITLGTDGQTTNIYSNSNLINTEEIGKEICINGHVIFNRHQIFRRCSIKFSPGASLEIESGYLFCSFNSVYAPCNGEMYKGIVVRGGGQIYFVDTNRVYDAHHGIELQVNSEVLAMNFNTFDRNYIGIDVNGIVLGQLNIVRNRFLSNGNFITFYSGQPSILETKTRAGVNLKNAIANIKENNYFYGINSAVIAENSIFNFFNNVASVLNVDASPNGSGVRATDCPKVTCNENTMTNCSKAFEIINSNFEAKENSIDLCIRGYELSKMDNRNCVISDNTKIYTYQIGLRLTESSNLNNFQFLRNKIKGLYVPGASGARADNYSIYIMGTGGQNSGNAEILDNNQEFSLPSTFDGITIISFNKIDIINNNINYRDEGSKTYFAFNLGSSSNDYIKSNTINGNGISTKNLGLFSKRSPYNVYCCNSFNDLHFGMIFQEDCDQSQLRHNGFSNHNIALNIADMSWIGNQKFGSSNKWPGSTSSIAEAQHLGEDQIILKSIFEVTTSGDYFPDPIDQLPNSLAVWFVPHAGSNVSCNLDQNCPNEVDPDGDDNFRYYGGEDAIISSNDEFTADASTIWTSSGQAWNAQIQLLEKIQIFPELIEQSDIVDSFYQANTSGSLNDYLDIRKAIATAVILDSANKSEFKLLDSIIEDKLLQIEEIDSLLSDSEADSISLIDDRNYLVENLDSLNLHYHILDSTVRAERKSVYVDIISEVEDLTASDATQILEKTANHFLLMFLSEGIDSITDNDIDTIFRIADTCIHLQSYAVSTCRMIYSHITDYKFEDDSLCVPAEAIMLNSADDLTKNDIVLSPNPASHNLNICSKEHKIKAIKVFNLMGQIVSSYAYPDIMNSRCLDINGLKNSMYLVEINLNNGIKVIKKVIIEP